MFHRQVAFPARACGKQKIKSRLENTAFYGGLECVGAKWRRFSKAFGRAEGGALKNDPVDYFSDVPENEVGRGGFSCLILKIKIM
jgi:hypothetical protein